MKAESVVQPAEGQGGQLGYCGAQAGSERQRDAVPGGSTATAAVGSCRTAEAIVSLVVSSAGGVQLTDGLFSIRGLWENLQWCIPGVSSMD